MINKLKTIKPLVIGLGIAGKRHLEAQINLGYKTGVYSTNLQIIKSLASQTNVIIFDDLQEAINWSNLIHVCTPDDKHTEYVSAALKKRRTVFCEKSLTTKLQDALGLQDISHKYGSKLIIAHNYRLTPTFMETRKRILEGSLGAITGITTTYFHDITEYQQRAPLRKNQDFLYIGGSHAVDLACWVAREQVVSVQASATRNKLKANYNHPKTYQIILRFVSGLLGHISLDASSARSISGTDLVVDGENGQLISNNKIDKLSFYIRGNKKPQSVQLPNRKAHTVASEIKIIDNYLLGKAASFWPLPEVDEAVNTIKVLQAIEKAVASGRSEVVIY